ncbi:carboxylesterase [Colletotrichum graminicola]|uniref:Carboxylesterase n=1 Tax=Colletotrichum graminicola (strain M1.001 / M2 / FGSC 10212) TaxID=645133 RepID=E3Q7F6_COLGM|nr:carboxylesterase [Colletotrichum graminicola M1.001]EFQ26794.1 carboxylesterase [Colletotrichum graminicola M1.001]WDK17653.1 carboxylesterase [Colletotrichum graminicola]
MPSITQTLVSLLSAAYVGQVQAVDPSVDLGYTKLRGVAEPGGATRWLGVRYAAPPLGQLRFAAPEDPPSTTEVVDASSFRPICLARSASDFTMKPNKRFTPDEDCLYLNIFAPSNATSESKLPVLYFIQGGGFQSLSNANFNGSDLAVFGNILVVQVNYRVGPYGFLQSKEVQDGASLNNGLKDQIQGLKWLKKHVAAFGGDPDHMVMSGDSAGATSVAMLLAAFGDNDPGLIKGAIMESVSVATIRTLEEGQEQYNCLTNATGCDKQADTLACLRSVNATALQTEDCQFNPNFDDDLVKASTLQSFAEGKYLKVPTIAGTCTDEGTKNVDQQTDTMDQALKAINDQATQSLSNASLALLQETYLDKPEPVFPNSGKLWRQLANGFGDFRLHCITKAFQDAMARDGVKTFNYRYGVLDEEQEALGFGAYHTVELNGVFGPNNTDGDPPKSYSTTNAPIVPLTQAYWASFVRTLDPNAAAIMAGMPEWKAWTVDGKQRLLFQNNTGTMEVMPTTQQDNCAMLGPMIPFIETPATDAQKASVQLQKVSGSSSADDTGMESESPKGAEGNGTKHDGGGMESGSPKGNGTKHDGDKGEGGKGGGGKGAGGKNGTGSAPSGTPPAAPSSATSIGYGFSGVLSAMLVVCVGHSLLAW